ncbi:nitronate monooxygenase [Rhodococcus sp. 077-4]|uniref:nitronate monooxygenase n=1 Tax=Rhodococcus sp. 077-4 TaxID=2789271 RepID=UPI0039F51C75
MFRYESLQVPVVGAPMAGGPSTPGLVTAVVNAGGLGFLAAGYLTPDKLTADIAAVRGAGTETFGVNLFVPEDGQVIDTEDIARYRALLQPYADELGVELPSDSALVENTDDFWSDKLDIVAAAAVPVVSFTFGCPDAETIARLHDAGSAVTVTVTNEEDARAAVDAGADSLCVQGPDAGGHRSTFRIDAESSEISLDELIPSIRRAVSVPIVAAGGITTASDVRRVLGYGAVAAQVGTALLRSPEAGTKPAHAAALVDPRFTETMVTRAFSGRPARALRNKFVDRFDTGSSRQYPAINTLTGGIRKASADDPHGINLWAGAGYRSASAEPAARIIEELASTL